MYHLWDEALGRGNPEEWLKLYARDATLESPLVPYLLGKKEGVVRGHEELLPLLKKVAERKPPLRQRYRTGYFSDGRKLMWEYPRETLEGDQMDFVEVMELNDAGLIQHHRVYWGWRGFDVLNRDEYHP
jgi:hypothetical protein